MDSIAGKTTQHGVLGDNSVAVVLRAVFSLAVPFLLATPFIDRFMTGIFSRKLDIVLHSFNPVHILATADWSEVPTTKKKHYPFGERNVSKRNILGRPEGTVLFMRYVEMLVKMEHTTRVLRYAGIDDSHGHYRGAPQWAN